MTFVLQASSLGTGGGEAGDGVAAPSKGPQALGKALERASSQGTGGGEAGGGVPAPSEGPLALGKAW